MRLVENVEPYAVCEPLFEGIRVILAQRGEKYSPGYFHGIAGTAFRVATGCPSRPTCCFRMWPSDFIRLLGYECTEIPCVEANGENLITEMIDAAKGQLDAGRPVLVWHAMTNAEWDVVTGYKEEEGVFYGRGSYLGLEEGRYHTEPWDRAAKAVEICPAFGAILIGDKTGHFDTRAQELAALQDAVAHARTVKDGPEEGGWYAYEGLQCLKKWAEAYSQPGKDRDAADAYCFQVYHSTHGTAAGFLREIAGHFPGAAEALLLEAARYMEEEAAAFRSCAPYLHWDSPWGVREERSQAVAPLLARVAALYEKAVECLEKALTEIIK